MAEKKKQKAAKKGKQVGPGRKNYWIEMDMENKLAAIEGWARQGSINEEIWTMLGISKELFYKWQREKPEFAAAVRAGKFESNGELLNAAFKQTTGQYVQVTEPIKLKTMKEFKAENGKMFWEEVEEIVDHTYMKYFPPNTTMGIFMLKNRLPENYRDKQDVNLTGDLSMKIEVDYGDDDE